LNWIKMMLSCSLLAKLWSCRRCSQTKSNLVPCSSRLNALLRTKKSCQASSLWNSTVVSVVSIASQFSQVKRIPVPPLRNLNTTGFCTIRRTCKPLRQFTRLLFSHRAKWSALLRRVWSPATAAQSWRLDLQCLQIHWSASLSESCWQVTPCVATRRRPPFDTCSSTQRISNTLSPSSSKLRVACAAVLSRPSALTAWWSVSLMTSLSTVMWFVCHSTEESSQFGTQEHGILKLPSTLPKRA